jgi:hypothetical protein
MVTYINPTSTQDLVYNPQYIAETTPGLFPTTGTMTGIAGIGHFALATDLGYVPLFITGSRDPAYLLAGRKVSGFVLRYNAADTALMKYAFNLAAGAGTISDTLSFAAQILVGGYGGTTYYFTCDFCRINQMTVSTDPGRPVMVEAHVICRDPTFTTSAPGPAFGTVTGTPMMFDTGGDDNVSFNSNTMNTTGISVRVSNNLTPTYLTGSRLYKAIPYGGRDISAVVNQVLIDPSKQWTDFTTPNTGTFQWTLNSTSSPQKKITISNANIISEHDISFNIADLSVAGRFNRGGGPVEEIYMISGLSTSVV